MASWLIYRAGGDDDDLGTPAGRMRFLGVLGLLVNGINLLLIVLEGSTCTSSGPVMVELLLPLVLVAMATAYAVGLRNRG